MQFCDNKHSQVCYEVKRCPVCEMRDSYEEAIMATAEDIEKLIVSAGKEED